MKLKRILGLSIGVLALVTVAGCNSKEAASESGSSATETTQSFDAEGRVKNFDKSITTTVKGTWKNDYEVTVDANGGTADFSSYRHKINATVEFEIDLGEDLYFYAHKTWQDQDTSNDPTETEYLLYKDGSTYYYVTTTTSKVEVTDAKAKLEEAFTEVTAEQAGSLSLSSLLYNSVDMNYELKNFSLTSTFEASDLAKSTYEDANGGLKVTYKPEYVGYKTDQGYSDFPAAKGANEAAVISILTNNKGQVTSMSEAYSAALDFAIMTPKPTVGITGSRSLTASYGDTITKKTAVAAVAATASYEQSTGGTYVVKTCAMGDFANMTDVTNGGNLEVGKIICVKPTADEGYEVDTVTVNGSTETLAPIANAGGWYCFNVIAGENTIVVTWKAAEATDPTTGTVTIPSTTKAKVEVYTCAPGGFASMTKVENGGEVTVGNWICIKVTPAGSNTVASVALNGSTTTLTDPANAGGYYCFTAAATNVITVDITGDDVLQANVTVTNSTNISYTLVSFPYAQPLVFTEVTDGKITPASNMFGAIFIATSDVPTNATITVTANGTATTVNIPNTYNGVSGTFYCFAVKDASDIAVVITVSIPE